jgi:hypothetical protein
MRHMPLLSLVAVSVAVAGLIALSLPVRAQPAAGKVEPTSPSAIEACERSARQSLPTQAADVTFNGAPTSQPSTTSDNQLLLRGGGRWRSAGGMRSFAYNCNVDSHTSEAVALVLRDTTPAAAAAPPARAPSEPNLSELSPAACESSAVEVLRQRWPRVSEISFDADTRTFKQESAVSAELHGSIRARPAPGSQPAVIGFDCEIDPRNGRVLRTNVSG